MKSLDRYLKDYNENGFISPVKIISFEEAKKHRDTLENTEKRPPISFWCSKRRQLFFLAILNSGESLNSVITIMFSFKVFKIFFSFAIFTILPNCDSVSGVLPDLEITIKPVVSISNLRIWLWKNNGSILSKNTILFG